MDPLIAQTGIIIMLLGVGLYYVEKDITGHTVEIANSLLQKIDEKLTELERSVDETKYAVESIEEDMRRALHAND